MLLEQIQKTGDVRNIKKEDLPLLAEEIREFLIDTLSENGGHLASNLGVVELTIALHLVFDPAKDRLIWDVGHQCYTHKILTGRKEEFDTLRKYDGLCGFPRRDESPCDAFDTGHSTTSISAGLGMAWGRELSNEEFSVVSVIGDGSLTGGMAYEAINNAAALKKNFIIVLNDNNMSISENVGGMSKALSKVRTSSGYLDLKEGVMNSLEKIPIYGDRLVASIRRTKSGIKQLVIPGMIFEEMGVMYLGPVDGHDIFAMEKIFREAATVQGPVLVHVMTHKGNGFLPAMRHPARFHGAEPFDKEVGIPLKNKEPSYTDIFSTVMRKMGERDPKLCAVTAAMMDGTGLKRFHNMFPERFFDVGIAEEHAVTFAAGLALRGMHPVVCIYSSFLQRAYDQIMEDVCQQNLPVVFAIDRAGIVGSDGATHQGIYDLSYLSTIPNLTIMAPKNKWELSDMIKFALEQESPMAIRYPRGEAYTGLKECRASIELGKAESIHKKGDILLFAIGSMVKTAEEVRDSLEEKGVKAAVTNARFVKPLDTEYLKKAMKSYSAIVTLEENVATGGFGQQVGMFLYENGYKGRFLRKSLPDAFIPHGSVDRLLLDARLDGKSVTEDILEFLK